ncbi:ATP-dependent helicase HrpB [Brevibacillus migulae]|uniref:ATP-dependent helicase HrpB n=1 Tax=Brevibacillus migulae TaxID=1644114 RepID=UPI00106E6921|nr:ATP-dependent helicase HrpB [Brevibacillus migulae]
MSTLPIHTVLPDIKKMLESSRNGILVAEPGAGKTTQVPLELMNEPWLEGRKILVLEPRRLAARSAARYMASSLGEQVGDSIGYRIKQDTRVGPHTRVEVITEGVLTRMLQTDPALEEVGLVIFDEFHERSLQADLGLALCLQSQALLRDDLRLLVMSATLDAEPIAALLGGAPVITSEGRSFPVETHYLERSEAGKPIESTTAKAVSQALREHPGDLLVFLPGVAEIRRVEAVLKEQHSGEPVRIAPLYGNMTQEQQDLAIAPSPQGTRKIVLATSIAESSLTVAGIGIVIDSGLMRVPRYSPRTGMSRLETIRVSRASADQRRGRAGRLGPGVCYRLWTEQEDRHLAACSQPEIMDADLTPLVLELALWGVRDPAELLWLDAPPQAAVEQAKGLLRQLGAIDETGVVTPHGRKLAALGIHPRLAHMVIRACVHGRGALACDLAALLGERDLLQGENRLADIDIELRVEALQGTGSAGEKLRVDQAALRRIRQESSQLKRQLGIEADESGDLADCGLLLAFAFPDRIAQRREDGRYLLSNGRGSVLPQGQRLGQESYLVAIELDDQGADSRILLAASFPLAKWLREEQEALVEEDVVTWDEEKEMVRARRRKRLGALVVAEEPAARPNEERVVNALLMAIGKKGIQILPWDRKARQLQQRMIFMHQLDSRFPDVSDEQLLRTLSDWLAPHLYGMKSRDDLNRLQLTGILEAMLSWEERKVLDEQAPTHYLAPSGSRIPIDYSDPTAPVLAVRLQEMFGLADTPQIGKGKIPLLLHLLSPASRPVQVTRDLASFWSQTYFEVKKDLKGRYPKHYWPDNPLEAMPTNRTRPQK